jgi:hypothetical protein
MKRIIFCLDGDAWTLCLILISDKLDGVVPTAALW